MTARPRHLHLVHSQDEPQDELETPAWNWGLIFAVAACLGVWTLIVAAAVVMLLT